MGTGRVASTDSAILDATVAMKSALLKGADHHAPHRIRCRCYSVARCCAGVWTKAMKMIMSGRHYEVSAPGMYAALWTSLRKKNGPRSVLINKQTGQKFALTLSLEDELHTIGDTYISCERHLLWPNREPFDQLRRASACCDLIGDALEQAINGDTTALAELAVDSSENLAGTRLYQCPCSRI